MLKNNFEFALLGILVPLGILDVKQKQFNVVYGNSRETSDFIVDGLAYPRVALIPALEISPETCQNAQNPQNRAGRGGFL